MRRALTCALATCLTLASAPAPALAKGGEPVQVLRIAGRDRYETMKWIANSAFASDSEWAVIATGEGFSDALSASALAGARKCPVVLTATGALSPDAVDSLKRLHAHKAYIVGGASAVSPAVDSTLRDMGIDAKRLSGRDRYDTAAAVAKEVRTIARPTSIAVVTGTSFADALSLGPWCYATASPVICVPKGGGLSGSSLAEATSGGYASAVIVGGASAVSPSVESQLKDMSVERLAGENRYATSARVAEWSCAHGLNWSRPAIATGNNFPDALAGAAAQGKNASPLLLVGSPSDPTVSLVGSHAKDLDCLYVLGGTGAVSDAIVTAIRGAQGTQGKGATAQALVPNAHNESKKTAWGPTLAFGVGEDGADVDSNEHSLMASVRACFGKSIDLHSEKDSASGSANLLYLHIYLDGKTENDDYARHDVLARIKDQDASEGVFSSEMREAEPLTVSGMQARVFERRAEELFDGGYTRYPIDYVAVLETAGNRLTVHLCGVFETKHDQQALGDVCAGLFRDYVSGMTVKGM